MLRFASIALVSLAFVLPSYADGIFAKEAHQTCRNTGKGTTAASLKSCCREQILSGGLYGPNDAGFKREVDKCVGMGAGGPMAASSGSGGQSSPQSLPPADPQQNGQQQADKEKKDCPSRTGEAVGGAIGGAFGGSLGGALGSAAGAAADADCN